MNDFVLIILGLLFSFYGIICAIECGAGLVVNKPRLSSNSGANKFIPDLNWQLINSMLLLVILVCYYLVRKTNLPVNHATENFLVIGFVALLIKLLISRSVYQRKVSLLNKLYAATCYLVPLSLGSIGVYMLTGKGFWLTFVGWTLMVSMFLGLTVVGLSVANRENAYLKRPKLRQYIDSVFCAWAVILGFAFPIGLEHYNSTLVNTPLSILEVVIIVGVVGYAITAIKQKKPFELYQYAILIGVLAPLLLALNTRSYLISLRVNLVQVLKPSSYVHTSSWLLYVFIVLITIVILSSVYVLTKLFNILPRLES